MDPSTQALTKVNDVTDKVYGFEISVALNISIRRQVYIVSKLPDSLK